MMLLGNQKTSLRISLSFAKSCMYFGVGNMIGIMGCLEEATLPLVERSIGKSGELEIEVMEPSKDEKRG